MIFRIRTAAVLCPMLFLGFACGGPESPAPSPREPVHAQESSAAPEAEATAEMPTAPARTTDPGVRVPELPEPPAELADLIDD